MKVHNSESLRNEQKRQRERTIGKNVKALPDVREDESTINMKFEIGELSSVLRK